MTLKFFLFSVTLLLFSSCASVSSQESKLLANLLNGYDKRARPVEKPSQNVSVEFGYTLTSLNKVDENNGVISFTGYVSLKWNDPKLKWNPKEYGKIGSVNILNTELWTPDIKIFNNVCGSKNFANNNIKVVVVNNGSIIYVPIIKSNTPCKLDTTYLSSNKLTCTVVFGSWTFSGDLVDTVLSKSYSSVAIDSNPKYKVTGVSAKRKVTRYACCEEPYVSIEVTMVLEKKSSINSMVNIVVGIVLSLPTFLQIILPVDSEHKGSTSGLLIVLNFVVLGYSSYTIPSSSSVVPLIIRYMACVTVLSVVHFLFSVVSLAVFSTGKQGKDPNGLVSFLNNILAKLVLMRQADYTGGEDENDLEMKDNDKGNGVGSKRCQRRKTKGQWFLAARVLDRFFSLLFIGLAVVLLIVFLN